jgi:hypothetical protein
MAAGEIWIDGKRHALSGIVTLTGAERQPRQR